MNPWSDQPVIHADDPAGLLAVVRYMIGLQPTSSLVIVALAGSRLLGLARLGLPATADQQQLLVTGLHYLAALMKKSGATRAVLVGYGTAAHADPSLLAATDALSAVCIPVHNAVRVDAGRYWSYPRDNADGEPADGVPFDPAATVAAAAAIAAGLTSPLDRAAATARFAPLTAAARDQMAQATATAAQLLVDLVEAAAPETSPDTPLDAADTPLGKALTNTGRTRLTQALHRYQAGLPVDDVDAALVTILLDLPAVRDFAARRTTAAPWQIGMWTDLVRRAEPDFVSGPAIMLALAALQAGDRALAAIAVERALHADPADRLAGLLALAIACGIDPATVTALLTG